MSLGFSGRKSKRAVIDAVEQTYIPLYAGFWRRAAALTIDGFFIMLVWSLMLNLMAGATVFNNLDPNSTNNVKGGLMLAILWLYSAGMESSPVQATLGKLAVRIVVTDMYGERISFLTGSVRYILKLLSTLFWGIGFIFAAFTQKKQALHDLAAGTLVSEKGPGKALPYH